VVDLIIWDGNLVARSLDSHVYIWNSQLRRVGTIDVNTAYFGHPQLAIWNNELIVWPNAHNTEATIDFYNTSLEKTRSISIRDRANRLWVSRTIVSN
jgi:hypothetical protein